MDSIIKDWFSNLSIFLMVTSLLTVSHLGLHIKQRNKISLLISYFLLSFILIFKIGARLLMMIGDDDVTFFLNLFERKAKIIIYVLVTTCELMVWWYFEATVAALLNANIKFHNLIQIWSVSFYVFLFLCSSVA